MEIIDIYTHTHNSLLFFCENSLIIRIVIAQDSKRVHCNWWSVMGSFARSSIERELF